MATKYFCDGCNREHEQKDLNTFKVVQIKDQAYRAMVVQPNTSFESPVDMFELCHKCELKFKQQSLPRNWVREEECR